MAQIFVSYSRHDSEFVDKLIAELEKLGYSVWLDREDIVGGDAWMASITEGIKQCQAYLIVLSPNSVGSDNVARELTMAFEKKKAIIPIRYQPYTLPSGMEFQLTGTQYVDFHGLVLGEGVQKLRRSLEQRRLVPAQPTKPIKAVDAKPAPPILPPMTLAEVIVGVWDIQPHDQPLPIGKISIRQGGVFRDSNILSGKTTEGLWHIESWNRLILKDPSKKKAAPLFKESPFLPSPHPKDNLGTQIIVFDKISQDELEGEFHMFQVFDNVKGSRQTWRRAK